jgi:hypothetical protein
MSTERIYEAFEIVRGREVTLLRDVSRDEALSIAKMHTQSDRRVVHVRNMQTGEVIDVPMSLAPAKR